MDVMKGVRRLAEILLLLSFTSITASPITSLLGIQQPPVTNITEMIHYTLIVGFVIIAFAIAAIFALGYIVLTGWREYRSIPKVVRLLLAFVLGALTFSLSGPISIVVPIPLISIVLTTILLWAIMRTVSNLLPRNEQKPIQIEEAIDSAENFIKQIDPYATNVNLLESKANGKNWEITLSSDSKKYYVNVDMKSGGIVGWKIS